MFGKSQPLRKKNLSFHEKNNRFYAVSLVTLSVVLFTVLMWFINRPSIRIH